MKYSDLDNESVDAPISRRAFLVATRGAQARHEREKHKYENKITNLKNDNKLLNSKLTKREYETHEYEKAIASLKNDNNKIHTTLNRCLTVGKAVVGVAATGTVVKAWTAAAAAGAAGKVVVAATGAAAVRVVEWKAAAAALGKVVVATTAGWGLGRCAAGEVFECLPRSKCPPRGVAAVEVASAPELEKARRTILFYSKQDHNCVQLWNELSNNNLLNNCVKICLDIHQKPRQGADGRMPEEQWCLAGASRALRSRLYALRCIIKTLPSVLIRGRRLIRIIRGVAVPVYLQSIKVHAQLLQQRRGATDHCKSTTTRSHRSPSAASDDIHMLIEDTSVFTALLERDRVVDAPVTKPQSAAAKKQQLTVFAKPHDELEQWDLETEHMLQDDEDTSTTADGAASMLALAEQPGTSVKREITRSTCQMKMPYSSYSDHQKVSALTAKLKEVIGKYIKLGKQAKTIKSWYEKTAAASAASAKRVTALEKELESSALPAGTTPVGCAKGVNPKKEFLKTESGKFILTFD